MPLPVLTVIVVKERAPKSKWTKDRQIRSSWTVRCFVRENRLSLDSGLEMLEVLSRVNKDLLELQTESFENQEQHKDYENLIYGL